MSSKAGVEEGQRVTGRLGGCRKVQESGQRQFKGNHKDMARSSPAPCDSARWQVTIGMLWERREALPLQPQRCLGVHRGAH